MMDAILGCANGRFGLDGSKRSKRTQRREPPPCQEGSDCIAGWLTKSPPAGVQHGWLAGRLTLRRFRPQWRRCFFVLSRVSDPTSDAADTYQLYYYADSGRADPLGSIAVDTLSRIATMIPPPVRLAETLSRPHRIRLQHQKPFVSFECEESHGDHGRRSVFYLLAESPAEMLDWADHLMAAAAGRARRLSRLQSSGHSSMAPDETDSGLGRRTLELRGAALDHRDAGETHGYVNLHRRTDSGGGVSVGSEHSEETLSLHKSSGTSPAEVAQQQPQPRQPHQRHQHYAILDMEAARQPNGSGAPLAPPRPSDRVEYTEVDRVRTRALAEIVAAGLGKR